MRILRTEFINETLLDELQAKVGIDSCLKDVVRWFVYDKVFEMLSSEKCYGQFKLTPQYLKVLSEIDLTDPLNDNAGLDFEQ